MRSAETAASNHLTDGERRETVVGLRSFHSSAHASSFKLVLTRREAEILRMVADGLSNKQIAQKLFLSTETIKSCLAGVGCKLDARNRAHAVSIGIRSGLID